MAGKKQPLTFNLERGPARVTASSTGSSAGTERLRQLGARIPESLYRELKAHAALTGENVQSVVQTIIADYLRQRRDQPS
jgi:hypothetical protein